MPEKSFRSNVYAAHLHIYEPLNSLNMIRAESTSTLPLLPLGALTRGFDIPANFNTAVYRQGRRWAGCRLCFATWRGRLKLKGRAQKCRERERERERTVKPCFLNERAWKTDGMKSVWKMEMRNSLFWFAPNSSSITNAIAWNLVHYSYDDYDASSIDHGA